MGALTGMGLVLAAWVPSRAAIAGAPVLGLACYLTFSRGALGATAAGLAALVAVAPTAPQPPRAWSGRPAPRRGCGGSGAPAHRPRPPRSRRFRCRGWGRRGGAPARAR